MSSVSSTSGASQFGWDQLKLQQARRNADQAEQAAQSLQAQAQAAQRTADRAEENARALAVDSNQARASVGKARQSLAAIQTEGQMQTQIAKVVDQVAQAQQSAPSSAAPLSAPVVNAQGQVTGTTINTTA